MLRKIIQEQLLLIEDIQKFEQLFDRFYKIEDFVQNPAHVESTNLVSMKQNLIREIYNGLQEHNVLTVESFNWVLLMVKYDVPRVLEDLDHIGRILSVYYRLKSSGKLKDNGLYNKQTKQLNYRDKTALRQVVERYGIPIPLGDDEEMQVQDENLLLTTTYYYETGEAVKHFENEKWLIVIPKTVQASKFYACSSSWCTRFPNHFNYYGELHICIDKRLLNTGSRERRLQFAWDDCQFMDMNDDAVNPTDYDLEEAFPEQLKATPQLVDADTIAKWFCEDNQYLVKRVMSDEGAWELFDNDWTPNLFDLIEDLDKKNANDVRKLFIGYIYENDVYFNGKEFVTTYENGFKEFSSLKITTRNFKKISNELLEVLLDETDGKDMLGRAYRDAYNSAGESEASRLVIQQIENEIGKFEWDGGNEDTRKVTMPAYFLNCNNDNMAKLCYDNRKLDYVYVEDKDYNSYIRDAWDTDWVTWQATA